MMYDIKDVIRRANELYQERKGYEWNGYTAPELQPQIKSDQVQAVAEALMEYIDERLNSHRDSYHRDPDSSY